MTKKKSNRKPTSNRRTYPDELKKEAVQMYLDGHSPASIVERLGLSTTNLIYNWLKLFNQQNQIAPNEKTVRELKDELARTQRERDILKKALAIFSQRT